ncbi:prepilin-type N-terminal cleavage/methylation domain-containing protein [Undibacterium jejuense]|uniref:Prepilin-type N-terminal cleavage/methylation domain-containing protein n=1 Tax=Undibacterium jejuense TaxID=1344949 RepID=A0A923KHX5_9BURK|nr:prepilin-type N-terminal cleavage/methylation domain-containing protein [Undibacterium jejuense]MBC3861687.1 prepilin-type N-terminal cleavage/methylation domain-containing protein [Undibacterium jejuense]
MHCKSRRFSQITGFTLIELLVAITILGIVAVLGWRGLDSIVRARQTLNGEMDQTRGIQIAFAQIENDCAHVMDANMLPGNSVLTAAGSKLMIIRSVFEDNLPIRFQVVVFNVVDGVLSRRELSPTRETAVLLAQWQSAAEDLDGTPSIPLQSKVESFSLRTWKVGETGWRMNGDNVVNAGDTATSANPVIPPNPANPANPSGASAKSATLAGVEVSMQVQGREAPMTKIFLLGAN